MRDLLQIPVTMRSLRPIVGRKSAKRGSFATAIYPCFVQEPGRPLYGYMIRAFCLPVELRNFTKQVELTIDTCYGWCYDFVE